MILLFDLFKYSCYNKIMENKKTRGGKRPGAGRPVSQTQRKSKTYTISLYPEEIEKLKEIARSTNITISQLLRNTFNL